MILVDIALRLGGLGVLETIGPHLIVGEHETNCRVHNIRDMNILDVNCTSPRSKPPATLKWYINNELVRR